MTYKILEMDIDTEQMSITQSEYAPLFLRQRFYYCVSRWGEERYGEWWGVYHKEQLVAIGAVKDLVNSLS